MVTNPEARIDVVKGVAVLEDAECRELLATTPIGRIGFWSEDAPLVLPVNFRLVDGDIVFRTLEGQKMAAAVEQQNVCFEVDHWDASSQSGWSVVVRGQARAVTNWAEVEQLEQLGLVAWTKDEWRPMWVRIESSSISGRRLR